jgi:hypothetical protein
MDKWKTKKLVRYDDRGYPCQAFNENCIISRLHFEVVKAQRWDLTPITRQTLYICLN